MASNQTFHGMVFTANSAGNAQTARSTSGNSYSCDNNFYGYELKTGVNNSVNRFYASYQESALFKIKDHSLVSGTITDITTHQSTDSDFIKNLSSCNGIIYTILDKKLYKTSGDTFSYSTQEAAEEVKPYIPGGNVIKSIDQVLFNPVFINNILMIGRKFDTVYGLDQFRQINKWSRIENQKTNETPTLFIKNNGAVNNVGLFAKTVELSNKNTTLTLYGTVIASNSFMLHLEAGTRWATPLYLKTIDPLNEKNNTQLTVYGSVSPATFNSKRDATLFMSSIVSASENNMPLSLIAPIRSDVSAAMNLTIINQLKNLDSNLSIVIQNDQALSSENASLFTVSVLGNTSNAANLTLYRKGVGGGTELENNIGLNMKNETISSNVSIYTDGISGISNSCNLVMPKINEVPSSNVSLNVFGYQE